jgi:hypothetical protein
MQTRLAVSRIGTTGRVQARVCEALLGDKNNDAAGRRAAYRGVWGLASQARPNRSTT